MTIKYLEWDSSFFKKEIGEIEFNSRFQSLMELAKFDLLYVKQMDDEYLEIDDFKQTFVETKVVFSKCISKSEKPINHFVFSAFDTFIKMEQIYKLAFESVKFSRFKLDANFHQREFEKLYKIWVDNSFSKKIADAILVYKENNDILGFISYAVFEKLATIGLIAVSPEHQGKGIGRKLLEAVESKLADLGIVELRIPSQLQNETACKFYSKMGYTIIEEKIVKHYWKI